MLLRCREAETLEVLQLSLHSSPLVSSASSMGGATEEGLALTGAGKLRIRNTLLAPSAGCALVSTKSFRYDANSDSISAAHHHKLSMSAQFSTSAVVDAGSEVQLQGLNKMMMIWRWYRSWKVYKVCANKTF